MEKGVHASKRSDGSDFPDDDFRKTLVGTPMDICGTCAELGADWAELNHTFGLKVVCKLVVRWAIITLLQNTWARTWANVLFSSHYKFIVGVGDFERFDQISNYPLLCKTKPLQTGLD